MRPAHLARLVRSAATRGVHKSSSAALAQPQLAPAAAGPCSVAALPSNLLPSGPSGLAGLTPQQVFAAHSLAQLGAAAAAEGGAATAEVADEVAARLRQHLNAAFEAEAGISSAAGSAAAASASVGGASRLCSAPAAEPATSLRLSAQAVAARLTKQLQGLSDLPHTLEGAMQPSEQARIVLDAAPPFRASWANPAWERLSGMAWRDVEGQPGLEVVGDGQGEGVPAALADALQAHARGTATLAHLQDGAPVPVRVTATPLLNRAGAATRMLLVFTPVKAPAVPS